MQFLKTYGFGLFFFPAMYQVQSRCIRHCDHCPSIRETALAREKETSTSIGHEIAVPHARIPNLPGVIGCMGICPEGVDFEGPYREPVRFVFLLLTPQQNYRSYIPVLAQIATLMRPDDTRQQFLQCQTPTEVTALIRQQDNVAH